MSECKIHILIGDNDIIVDDVENFDISTFYKQIKDRLISSEQFDLFKELVQQVKPDKYGRLLPKQLVANHNTDTLSQLYGIKFPIKHNNILLVNNFKVNGKQMYGLTTDAYGNELYVVKSNAASVAKLASHLLMAEKIKQYNFRDNLPEAYIGQEELLKHDLIDYLIKGKNYISGYINDVDAKLEKFNILKQEMSKVSKYPLKPEVSDSLSRDILNFMEYKEVRGKIIPYIPISRLKRIGSTGSFEEGATILDVINYFVKQPDVSMKFKEMDDTDVIFTYYGDSLSNTYDKISIGTIGQMVEYVDDYKGYYIFKIKQDEKTDYIVSRNWITLNTMISNKTFNTAKDAQKEIDSKNTQSKISNNFVPELYYEGFAQGMQQHLNTSKIGVRNDVIRALDINIPAEITIDNAIRYQDMSLNKFVESINQAYPGYKLLINSIINTNEKAMILLHRLGKNESINDILQDIQNAKYRYYIIENIQSLKAFKFSTTLHRIEESDLGITTEEPKYQYVSMFNVLNNIADEMQRRFGFEVNVLSASQIKSKFEDILGPGIEQEKAFIYDGNIYVNATEANSSDLVHEYLHLFLGALKSQNFDKYEELMNTFNNNQLFKGLKKKAMSNTRYANLADTDLNEEVIVKLLSNYIVGYSTTPLDEELVKL